MAAPVDDITRWRSTAHFRHNYHNLWDDCAIQMLPQRIGFNITLSPGERRTKALYDSTPAQGAQSLSSSIEGLMLPKGRQWGEARAADPMLMERDDVKLWFDEANKRTHNAIYLAAANFQQASGELFLDMVVFGTGNMMHGESRDRTRQMFRAIHLKKVYLAENFEGNIDTVYTLDDMTARQLEQRWGKRIPDQVKDASRDNPDHEFPVLRVVRPSTDFTPGRLGPQGMPWMFRAYVMASGGPGEGSLLEETGMFENPMVSARWTTVSGEVYGWSPGRLALPDSKTLQAQDRTLLSGGQLAARPPLIAPNDGLVNAARIVPAGVIPYDATSAIAARRLPIEPLNVGTNLPIGREMQNDKREQIWRAFYRNVLQLPVDAPQMTATEVIERKQEFLRVIGPTFGRLESEVLAPIYTRAFAIELRAGRLPPIPPALSNAQLEYQFMSPVQQVFKQIEAESANKIIQDITPLASAKPEVLDNFDFDQMSRDIAEAYGPQRWVVPRDVRDQIRAARAQRQAEDRQLEQLRVAAETANVGASAAKQIGQAQQQLAPTS